MYPCQRSTETVAGAGRHSADRSVSTGARLPIRLYREYYAVILSIKAHLY